MCKLSEQVFKVEKSKSRRGKHVLYSTVYVYKKKEGLIPYTKVVFSEQPTNPTYSRGEAKIISLALDHGDLVVYAWFVRNFRKQVKGYISVYSSKGQLLYRAKYKNGFVVFSEGSPAYAWLVRLFLELQKIPVTATRLGDEK